MLRLRVCLALWAAAACPAHARTVDTLLGEALAAESRLDTRRALELLQEAERLQPDDALILRRIARQYSDLTLELPDRESRKQAIERALDYSRRAVSLDPANAEGVLSLAVCHGKLALYSDTRDKVALSRLVRTDAERALALDPTYAWAHHLLGRWHYEVHKLGSVARWVVRLIYGGLPDASTADAVRHLERAVELEPDQLQHHLELGFAYLAHGDPARARASFAAGLALPSRAKHDEPAKQRARDALARL